MNGDMAQRARLVFLRLVVERGRHGRNRIHGQGVALEAEQIDGAAVQHAGIGRSVRVVTRDATLRFDGRMLEGERSLLLGVARETDGVLRGRCAELPRPGGVMRTVTTRAREQPLVHSVMRGAIEIRPNVLMAAVTELRLRDFQQTLRRRRLMGRMAVGAPEIVDGVRGTREVAVLVAELVAVETDARPLALGDGGEADDVGLVAAALHVRLSGSMA